MKVTARQLRELSDKELQTLLRESQEELRMLHFEEASGQLKQKNKIGVTRTKISRIKTVLNERK